MLTFWGEFALVCLAAYVLACWLISKIPSPKRQAADVASAADSLQGGNRERSQSKFYGWY